MIIILICVYYEGLVRNYISPHVYFCNTFSSDRIRMPVCCIYVGTLE